MIESGELDVLVAIDETLEDTDILIRRPLRRETAHLIARKGHPLTQMERCAYADIIQYRFASPFMTDNLIRWFQAGRNDETRQAHYLICHDRSEEHTSELQSLMRLSYAVFCWNTNTHTK